MNSYQSDFAKGIVVLEDNGSTRKQDFTGINRGSINMLNEQRSHGSSSRTSASRINMLNDSEHEGNEVSPRFASSDTNNPSLNHHSSAQE